VPSLSESPPPLYATSSLLPFLPTDVQVLELLMLPLPANASSITICTLLKGELNPENKMA